MPLSGTVKIAEAGVLGLDFNADGQTMTPQLAEALRDAGYRFCLRYVPREAEAKTVAFDLRKQEAQFLLDSGFALMVVQHFERDPEWVPFADKGRRYGAFAAQWAREKIELPEGVCVFLDLEAVKSGTPKQDIIDYCLAWHGEVKAAGYAPGIYVGNRARLTGKEIAEKLPFEHHWEAFNEQFEIPTGIQLKQIFVTATSPLRPAGAKGFRFQADRTSIDNKGRALRWLAP
ncbi:MAG TPA: glycoside hydrolase domain-containing protein [Longimicrobium sp.]|nr:glycoside hydrolase domain-containing protein [Longimicrobium sp.]